MLDLTTTFMTFPILETQRFVLREITLDDASDMFRIMSDPRVMRYFGSEPMTSHDQAIDRAKGIHEAFAEQSGVRWAITRREDGQFIGTCGFWRLIKEHFRAEIGYELDPAFWGQGVMTEAVGGMLRFGFTRMGLHSVEAHIDPANTGSRRVLEKLGFVQEGYFRDNYYLPSENVFSDTAVFSLLKDTFLKSALGRPDQSVS